MLGLQTQPENEFVILHEPSEEEMEKLNSSAYEKLERSIRLNAVSRFKGLGNRDYVLSEINETTETMEWAGDFIGFNILGVSNQSSGHLIIEIYFPNNTLISSNKVSGIEILCDLLVKLPHVAPSVGSYFFNFIPENMAYAVMIGEVGLNPEYQNGE